MDCRDARLLSDHDLPSGEIDKIYSRVKPEAQPTINFVQFMEGLRFVAVTKRFSLNEVRTGQQRYSFSNLFQSVLRCFHRINIVVKTVSLGRFLVDLDDVFVMSYLEIGIQYICRTPVMCTASHHQCCRFSRNTA